MAQNGLTAHTILYIITLGFAVKAILSLYGFLGYVKLVGLIRKLAPSPGSEQLRTTWFLEKNRFNRSFDDY